MGGGGGDAAGGELSPSQSRVIGAQQIAEFRKRYGGGSSSSSSSSSRGGGARLPGDYAKRSSSSSSSSSSGGRGGRRRRAELVLCVDAGSLSILGCAGIEVSDVKRMDGYDSVIRDVPVMSNLAVGREYRRRGIAEGLVRYAEGVASGEWGYGDGSACYLYVEGRNRPALKLYEKLGYVEVWEDGDATTLSPGGAGELTSGMTTIVCMRRELGGGMFGNLFRRRRR